MSQKEVVQVPNETVIVCKCNIPVSLNEFHHKINTEIRFNVRWYVCPNCESVYKFLVIRYQNLTLPEWMNLTVSYGLAVLLSRISAYQLPKNVERFLLFHFYTIWFMFLLAVTIATRWEGYCMLGLMLPYLFYLTYRFICPYDYFQSAIYKVNPANDHKPRTDPITKLEMKLEVLVSCVVFIFSTLTVAVKFFQTNELFYDLLTIFNEALN